MSLQTDDGKILEAKEGVVLDSNDQLVMDPFQKKDEFKNHAHVKSFTISGWLAPLFLVGAVIGILTLGTFFVGAILFGFVCLSLVRIFFRLFKI